MSKPSSRQTLEGLLPLLAKSLTYRILSGEATAAELNVARQLLKDNGIEAHATETNAIGQLAHTLPFQSAAEIDAADDSDTFH